LDTSASASLATATEGTDQSSKVKGRRNSFEVGRKKSLFCILLSAERDPTVPNYSEKLN
jgi:hypothetical protein